ncbi:unnamed protein product [Adineta steineri]|uniref:Uncharacterized protein n=1 Tax=Adineta steineri TaxID=433720 RepID=A0A814A4Y5_9BILA|nr:unnamed protein product [Adineta steineri]CAF0906946.1 unnamed protein product [Adineta steineri]CAF3695682.1 unnamed protein product [Adineta steineri]CAF3875476.1 unnamed protein product [Adineta steineri]
MDPTEVIFDFEMVGGVKEKLRQIKKVIELSFQHSDVSARTCRLDYMIMVPPPDDDAHKAILQDCTRNLSVLGRTFPTRLRDEIKESGGAILIKIGRSKYRIWVGLSDPESHKLILQECTKKLPVLEKIFPTKLRDETIHLGGSLLRKIIEQAHKLAIKRSIGTGQPTEITTNDIEKTMKVCKKLKDSSEENK